MGLLRRRGGDDGTKYRMRERLFAVGDDFLIENGAGERAFKVDGKALRIRDTPRSRACFFGSHDHGDRALRSGVFARLFARSGNWAAMAAMSSSAVTPLRGHAENPSSEAADEGEALEDLGS